MPRPTGYRRDCAAMDTACAPFTLDTLHLPREVAMEAPPLASLSLTHVHYVGLIY